MERPVVDSEDHRERKNAMSGWEQGIIVAAILVAVPLGYLIGRIAGSPDRVREDNREELLKLQRQVDDEINNFNNKTLMNILKLLTEQVKSLQEKKQDKVS